MLVVTTACWATYPVTVKLLVSTVGALDSSFITAIRYLMMAVLSAPLFFAGAEAPPDSQGDRASTGGLAQAALELAAVGTAGTLLNTWGIEHTTAVRAALLLASINVLTPLLSATIGSSRQDRAVAPETWLGCLVSFGATAWATAGGAGGEGGGLGSGDLSVLAATLCYATVKVRLADKARTYPAEALAPARLFFSAVCAVAVLGASCGLAGTDAGAELGRLSAEAWGLLLFSAVAPGVVATLLQAKGQRVVPPAQAQTIYAGVPLFAACYSFAVLGEPIGDREVVAGVAIVAAATLSAKTD